METKPKLENIDLGEVLGVGAALAQPRSMTADGSPFLTLPAGWIVKDVESFMPAPMRAKGSVSLGDVESFVRYVNKHKDKPGAASAARLNTGSVGGETVQPDADDLQTVIYANVLTSKFRAVFNAHSSDAPGWGDHIAAYDCPLSKEWQTWTGNNGKEKAKDQEDFAFFVEQNALDIVEPAGATMLEIVTTLKSVKNVAFDSGLRLNDGRVQIKYHEENTAKAGEAGQFEIPEKIKLGIPVYVGAEAYAVEALFRYRISGSKLLMWYDLVRPHKILEAAFEKVQKQIAEGSGITPYTTTSDR